MWTTITNYWVEILLTVTSIIVGFLVGYAFYRLQKRDVASARVERVKRAKEELLDIIESQIINKQQFAEELIHNLIVASEREHQVGLKDFCTPVTLLQDVALRLQKSRHLDIVRKSEYSDQIEQTITTINEHHTEVPEDAKESLELVGVLEDTIQNDEKQKSLETIAALKKKLVKAPLPVSTEYVMISERLQQFTSLITGIAGVIVTFIIATEFFGVAVDLDRSLQNTIIPTILIAIILTTLVFFLTIAKKWS